MQPSKANVIVAIPTNGNDGREAMSGAFDYANGHTNWTTGLIALTYNFVASICEGSKLFIIFIL